MRKSDSYTVPKNMEALSIQAIEVATQVLNGEIDLKKAKTYSALARVTCQAVNTQVTLAKMGQLPKSKFLNA